MWAPLRKLFAPHVPGWLRACYTQTSSGNVENTQPRFGSPLRDAFLTFRLPCSCFDPYFGKHCAKSSYQPLC